VDGEPDVAGLVEPEPAPRSWSNRLSARLVLVDSRELQLQRARYREERHVFAPADGESA
jgi:hypothetical protein